MDVDKLKSYATEENLKKAIADRFPADVKYIVVCNRKGRFVAIFPYSWIDQSKLNVGGIVHSGFAVLG